MVAGGGFREDLYHRFAVFPVTLPPLRDRRDDIPPLANALLARIGPQVGRGRLTLTPAAQEALTAGDWSGNVRQLANVLERAAILAEGTAIDVDDLQVGSGTARRDPWAPSLEEAERHAIEQAMAKHDGNRKQMAEHLGIGLRTLYDKLKRYGLR